MTVVLFGCGGFGGVCSQLVGLSGCESRPLRERPSPWPLVEGRGPVRCAAGRPEVRPLRPAGRRVLPWLLAPVHGEVHERVGAIYACPTWSGARSVRRSWV